VRPILPPMAVSFLVSDTLRPEVPLRVFAASDPDVACSFFVEIAGGYRVPYDLTGAAVEFYLKPKIEDPDRLPTYSTANGSIAVTNAPAGLASIHFDSHDIRYASQARYHVDAVRGGRRTVLGWGALSVVDR
jgi:hypothetical protein